MLGSLEEDRTINQSLTTPFLKEFKSTKSVDFVAKVLIVGDSRAGKTCLFRRFSDDLFNENYRKTGAVEFRHRYLHTHECKTKIQVWDCVSSASHIMNSIYKGADAVIVTVDTTNGQSLLSIEEWIGEITKSSPLQVKIYLVGTKSDVEENRALSEVQLQEKAEEFRLGYMEVSSKNGHNVDNLFYRIVSDIHPLKVTSLRRKSLNDEDGGAEGNDGATRMPLSVRNDSNVTIERQDGDQTMSTSLQRLVQDCNCVVM